MVDYTVSAPGDLSGPIEHKAFTQGSSVLPAKEVERHDL